MTAEPEVTLELLYERALADAGVPGEQEQLAGAGFDDFEAGHQRRQLALAPEQLLRDTELARAVVHAELEVRDRPGGGTKRL